MKMINLYFAKENFLRTLLLTISLIFFSSSITLLNAQCEADAGSFASQEICMLDAEVVLAAVPAEDAVVPDDFETLFVLTTGEELVIRQVADEPSFTVEAPAGLYTIHTLIYDDATLDLNQITLGFTTGFEVNALLQQGGGDICGSLDVDGVKFRFGACDDEYPCTAESATISTEDLTVICADDGVADPIDVTVEGGNGTDSQWIITDADGNILSLPEAPPFDLEGAGAGVCQIWYVTYEEPLEGAEIDANVADLSGCFALSNAISVTRLAGAECQQEECTAEAGTLRSFFQPCLRDGAVTLTVRVDEPPVIPEGYEMLYVLTAGNSLVIEQVSSEPNITVTSTGRYRVHSLVKNATLNLDAITLGETTASELNALLVQGGGSICAALDLTGTFFSVVECPDVCRADAGTMKPSSDACLDKFGNGTISAVSETDPNVLYGYKVTYLLSFGEDLVIEAISSDPVFHINEKGEYRIHRFVYDPDEFSLSTIREGSTTATEVNAMLKQGGGEICAGLDLEGAFFDVSFCRSCYAFAGTLWVQFKNICLEHGHAKLVALHPHTPIVPEGYEVIYLLAAGDDLIIEETNDQPLFEVYYAGDYSIHTLVYNPETLDLEEELELWVTTIYDINALLKQGGGKICGSLDKAGAAFHVKNCHHGYHRTGNATLFPNPANNTLSLQFENLSGSGNIEVQVIDLDGKVLQQQVYPERTHTTSINIAALVGGMYVLEIRRGGEVIQQERFVKSE